MNIKEAIFDGESRLSRIVPCPKADRTVDISLSARHGKTGRKTDMTCRFLRMGTARCMLLAAALLLLLPAVCDAMDALVTSPFGWRIHPISGGWKFHAGVDLGYDYGTQVPALYDGVVVQSGDFSDGYGIQALIYHEAMDSYSRYAHMCEIYVTAGQAVRQGAVIGLVGSTGNSTGPHLHLEFMVRSADGGYVYTDPLLLWQ